MSFIALAIITLGALGYGLFGVIHSNTVTIEPSANIEPCEPFIDLEELDSDEA